MISSRQWPSPETHWLAYLHKIGGIPTSGVNDASGPNPANSLVKPWKVLLRHVKMPAASESLAHLKMLDSLRLLELDLGHADVVDLGRW